MMGQCQYVVTCLVIIIYCTVFRVQTIDALDYFALTLGRRYVNLAFGSFTLIYAAVAHYGTNSVLHIFM